MDACARRYVGCIQARSPLRACTSALGSFGPCAVVSQLLRRMLTARAGWTLDTTTRLLKATAFNPLLTLPLVLAAKYTSRGSQLALQNETLFRTLRSLLAIGVLGSISGWLDDKVVNNWKTDEWDWAKEVVVVTGGSDGIGKSIVFLLAEKGIKVAVVDVQKLTYEGTPAAPNPPSA
jgi:hypothetical protein